MSKLKQYAVLSHLTWNDEGFEPGSTVEMDEDTARPLIDDGVLADPDAKQAGAEAAPEPADAAEAFAAHLGQLKPEERIAALRDMAGRANVFEELFPEPGPPDEDVMAGALAEGFPRLKPEDFGRDRKPSVKAVERVTGLDWSADKRDAAWALLPQIAAGLAPLAPPKEPEQEPEQEEGQ